MTDSGSPWWHDAVVYQVYIRSFSDSNGDGIGDLRGIQERLPYLADLGVDALWITPFYPSPMADHGYDVADYCDIDPVFGSLTDFDKLLVDAHAHDLRVLIDLVPNHTSSAHPWFQDALSGPTAAHRDWYIFHPPAPRGGPPNNWESVFGGPAWTLDEASGEYYLHLFDPGQPDLNWRNPEVHQAWRDILRFWLDRGVDGFRIDVAHGLYKAVGFPDNPQLADAPPGTEHLHSIDAVHCWDQPEVLDVYRDWRRMLDGYDDRMTVGEVFLYDLDRVARYVGGDRLHQSFNFLVTASPFEPAAFRGTVQRALERLSPNGAGPTWVLSNHDLVRHVTRYGGGQAGRRRARAASALLLGLPGAPYLYQGEELGLEQSDVPPAARQDPIWRRSGGTVEGRDGCRTPIPWTTQAPGHGFTEGRPWLPFGADSDRSSVERQQADPASTLTFYRQALAERRAWRGRLHGQPVAWIPLGPDLIGCVRSAPDGEALLVLANFSRSALQVPVPAESVRVLIATEPGLRTDGTQVTIPAESTAWLAATGLDASVSLES